MRADVVDLLACPHCHAGLAIADRVLVCVAGHSFDIARQGYVNLLPGDARTGTADTVAMVAARADFLAAGHYAPLVTSIVTRAAALSLPDDGCVLDLGAGTGYYVARVLDALSGRRGLALDLSKHAARRAARAHDRLGVVVCDAWRRLPVLDDAAALALSIFAPRDGAELARILAPGGALLVVTPTARHLWQLVAALDLLTVDEHKRERLDRALAGRFRLTDEQVHRFDMTLTGDDITAVVAMGPNAWHTAPADVAQRVVALRTPLQVTAEVRLASYRLSPPTPSWRCRTP